jgi:hypothetical protein
MYFLTLISSMKIKIVHNYKLTNTVLTGDKDIGNIRQER